ncbi:DUF805 domain-containing protein [Rhodobacterales bacterium HKCCSP123]|nr:DUF805 domain-containing protein [Rhodobacterales bacterium HKCCSP123]
MDFMTAIRTCFGKYLDFSDRAQRSEFWWFALFSVAGSFILRFIDGILFGWMVMGHDISVLSALFGLIMIIPSIAVAVRRLHDLDMSGWWYLLVFIPFVGALVLIYFFVQRGTVGPNRFGRDPLGG